MNAEEARLTKEIKRSNEMLSNQNFILKAPKVKVDEEKNKLANYTREYEIVIKRLKDLETL